MVKNKRNFSIEFPEDDQKHSVQSEAHYDIHEYSSEEVSKMRQQAKSIINLTKAMGVNTVDKQQSSSTTSEAATATSQASSAPRTREQFRASMESASHPTH